MIRRGALLYAKGSGILTFMTHNREVLLRENPKADEYQISQKLMEKWNDLSAGERYAWNQTEVECASEISHKDRNIPQRRSQQRSQNSEEDKVKEVGLLRRKQSVSGYVYFYKEKLPKILQQMNVHSVTDSSKAIFDLWNNLSVSEKADYRSKELESHGGQNAKSTVGTMNLFMKPYFEDFFNELALKAFKESKPPMNKLQASQEWAAMYEEARNRRKKLFQNVRPSNFGVPAWGPSTWLDHFEEHVWNSRESYEDGLSCINAIKKDSIDAPTRKKYECRAFFHNLAEDHKRVTDCCRRASIGEDHPERDMFVHFIRALLQPKYFTLRSYEIAVQIVLNLYQTMSPMAKGVLERFSNVKNVQHQISKKRLAESKKAALFLHLRDVFAVNRKAGLTPVEANCAGTLSFFENDKNLMQKLLRDALQMKPFHDKGHALLAEMCFLEPSGQLLPRLKGYVKFARSKVTERKGETLEKHVEGATSMSLYAFFLKENCRKRMLAMNCTGIEAVSMLVKEFHALTPDEMEKLRKRAYDAVNVKKISTLENMHVQKVYALENYARVKNALNTTDEGKIRKALALDYEQISDAEKFKIIKRVGGPDLACTNQKHTESNAEAVERMLSRWLFSEPQP